MWGNGTVESCLEQVAGKFGADVMVDGMCRRYTANLMEWLEANMKEKLKTDEDTEEMERLRNRVEELERELAETQDERESFKMQSETENAGDSAALQEEIDRLMAGVEGVNDF